MDNLATVLARMDAGTCCRRRIEKALSQRRVGNGHVEKAAALLPKKVKNEFRALTCQPHEVRLAFLVALNGGKEVQAQSPLKKALVEPRRNRRGQDLQYSSR